MKIFKTNNKNFYNNKFPYTNFYISKISFWNEIEINYALEEVANNDLQFIQNHLDVLTHQTSWLPKRKSYEIYNELWKKYK